MLISNYPLTSLWTFLLCHAPVTSASQHPLVSEDQLPNLSEAKYLNISAMTAANGTSIFECWQLSTPFFVSTQPGTAGSMVLSLGNLEKASYSIVPAGINDGYHTAPANQYVITLSGLAKVSVPERGQEAILSASKNSIVIAVDTADVSELGHVSEFVEKTTVLQIPFAGGVVPEHTVLYQEPCSCDELME